MFIRVAVSYYCTVNGYILFLLKEKKRQELLFIIVFQRISIAAMDHRNPTPLLVFGLFGMHPSEFKKQDYYLKVLFDKFSCVEKVFPTFLLSNDSNEIA